MNLERVARILRGVGLSDNETSVYLAALSLGPTTAAMLSKQSGIKRTTVYSAIESLQEKGILHEEPRGLKRVFVAEHPDKLNSVLQAQHRLLHSILPELSSMYFRVDDTTASIKTYSGLDGIKRIYDGLLKELKAGDFYLVISDQQKWISHDPVYFEKFKRERAKLDLSIRLLLQDSPSARRNKPLQGNISTRYERRVP
jgi:sugar-specific transcriptional regulator TrmB